MYGVAQAHLPFSLLSSTIYPVPQFPPLTQSRGALTCMESANSPCCGNNKGGLFYLAMTLGKGLVGRAGAGGEPWGNAEAQGLLEGWPKLVLG